MDCNRPSLKTHRRPALPDLDRAYRIALGDLEGNIQPFKDGLLLRPEPCILAGLDYDTPWTRDAAFNVSNAAGLFFPIAARNTLLSVLSQADDQVQIGGQYWDAVVWALGAWDYYLFTGDRPFLKLALVALSTTLAACEAREFDPHTGLFRGPAVYGDGVAAYPDRYAQPSGSSFILDWRSQHPQQVASPGEGMPMMALSTNAAYYQAYRIVQDMAQELDQPLFPAWSQRAEALAQAIQTHFWDETKANYRYLADPWGGCDRQEGLGASFALLFDLADAAQAGQVLANQHITAAGAPCLWPSYERYTAQGAGAYGRHSGTVWPHVQGFWGEAALRFGRPDLFTHELYTLAARAVRDSQFAEIYHPDSGEIYGGWQESPAGMHLWKSCARQTWSATAYLRLVLRGLAGMEFSTAGIRLRPYLPEGMRALQIGPLGYRGAVLDIRVKGPGTRLRACRVNGQPGTPFIPANLNEECRIELELE